MKNRKQTQKKSASPTKEQLEREKAYKDMKYWLARIYARSLADMLRGKKDV